MENAVDALKIAAAILVFIIAIGSSFSLFGTAKHTADSIVTMRDKQAYLDVAEFDNGVLYTSTESIESMADDEAIGGVNNNGHRVVKVDDVVSTILRYNKEKYGVTIIDYSSKKVLFRFDSNTENVMRRWNNIVHDHIKGKSPEQQRDDYVEKIKDQIDTPLYVPRDDIKLTKDSLAEIYAIEDGDGRTTCGAPWYGNDEQIRRRIVCELFGEEYEYNKQKFKRLNPLYNKLIGASQIIEVTNEIDQSDYLKDTDGAGNEVETNLLMTYEMPAVEVVYILR